MRVEYLYRYPVKGLSAEALETAELVGGRRHPMGPRLRLAQGDGGFDPERPEWRPKQNFMCGAKNARIAGLRAFFDPRSKRLTLGAPDGAEITEDATSAAGRERLGAFLSRFLGEEARGVPAFHHVPGHVFGDSRIPVVSLIGLASLRDFEARLGAKRHRRRFRANVWFTGAPPWAELSWPGRQIRLGGATLRVLKRIPRCAATEVNPLTAERDADPVAELRALYGHSDLGVYAEVIEGGRFAVGDAIELISE